MEDIDASVTFKSTLEDSLGKMNLKAKVGMEIYKLFGFLDCISDSDVQNHRKEGEPPQKSSELVIIGDDTSNAQTKNKEGEPPPKSSELVIIGDDNSISTNSTPYYTGNKHKF